MASSMSSLYGNKLGMPGLFLIFLGVIPIAFSFFASFLIFFLWSLTFFWTEYCFLRVYLLDVFFLTFGMALLC